MYIYIHIQVSLHIPGSQNLALQLPIVIGTVPYRQTRHSTSCLQTADTPLSDIHLLPAPPPYSESTNPPPFGGLVQLAIDEIRIENLAFIMIFCQANKTLVCFLSLACFLKNNNYEFKLLYTKSKYNV